MMNDIKGYEGLYAVTDDGRVWSYRTNRWLRPGKQKYGHRRIVLSRKNRPDHRLVHRLVLEAFVGPCPAGMECRHLDGNPANNRLENLCWGTPQENAMDRGEHQRTARGEKATRGKLKIAEVREIKRCLRVGEHLETLARRFKASITAIWKIKHGKSWGHVNEEQVCR